MKNHEVVTREEYIKRSDALKMMETANRMVSRLLEATMKLCVVMNSIAAADVVPVRHGHWIQREDNDGALIIPFVSCSSCHYDWDFETPFCPNCGALMDKDGDEDGTIN